MTVIVDEMFGLQPGQRIGSYEVLDAIGGGGMGMVYRAVHVLLDRPAAIKVLRSEYDHVPAIVHRFFTEARLTTAIRHPGIVEVYDFGHTDDGHAYIVMELLAGDSLAARLARVRRLPWPTAVVLARRIASALAAAHERGVVHRDLKPDNVHLIRDPDGGPIEQIKLLDFGIAKLVGHDGSQRTTTGVVMGTPMYMAPEQCRGLGDTDHRVDLYALGCVLHEMVAGRPPFVARSTGDLLAAHLQLAPRDVREHAPEVPSALARLIAQLLAKDPGARPGSAEAVLHELDAVAAAAPGQPRRPLTMLATAIGLVAVAVGLVLGRMRGRGTVQALPAAVAPTYLAPASAGSSAPVSPPPAVTAVPTRVIVKPPLALGTLAPASPGPLAGPAVVPAPPRARAYPPRPPRPGLDDVTSDLGSDHGDDDDGLDTIVRDVPAR